MHHDKHILVIIIAIIAVDIIVVIVIIIIIINISAISMMCITLPSLSMSPLQRIAVVIRLRVNCGVNLTAKQARLV